MRAARALLVLLLGVTLVVGCARPAAPDTEVEEVEVTREVEVVVTEEVEVVREVEVERPAEVVEPPAPPEADAETTLTVAVSGDYGSLDWVVGGFFMLQNEARKHIFGILNDNCVLEEEDGTLVADAFCTEPYLAESVEVLDDGLRHRITLMEGVRHYPSGRELTAFDWWWYARRWAGLGRLLYETVTGGYATEDFDMWGYRVIDKYTVDFVARHWTPTVKPLVHWHLAPDSQEYMAHATRDDPWATEFAHDNMVGPGPYFIYDREPEEYTIWRVNPYFPPVVRRGAERGFEPFFKQIEFLVVPSEADRVMLLRAGEVDIAWDISARMIDELRDDEGVKTVSNERGDVVGILMHNAIEPFDDVRVRRAVSYLVPYDDILETALFGLATPMRAPVASLAAGVDESHWPYDVPEDEAMSEAKALLADAGYSDGFEFTLAYDSGEAQFETAAILIQSQLAQADIVVNLQPMPRAAFTEQLGRGELAAAIHSTTPFVPEVSYYHAFLYDCGSVLAGTYIEYCNPEVDELIKQGSMEPDDTRRNELYSEAQRLLIEDAPWVWIAARNLNRAMGADIQGHIEYMDGRYRYEQLWRE